LARKIIGEKNNSYLFLAHDPSPSHSGSLRDCSNSEDNAPIWHTAPLATQINNSVALHYMFYNFCRIHQTLKVTPAMEAGLTDHVWTLAELLSVEADFRLKSQVGSTTAISLLDRSDME